MTNCPYCNAPIRSGLGFCSQCEKVIPSTPHHTNIPGVDYFSCPSCKKPLALDATRCNDCGWSLAAEGFLREKQHYSFACDDCGHELRENVCPNCGKKFDIVTCFSCGHLLKQGTLFCSQCGERRQSVDADEIILPPRRKRRLPCLSCGALVSEENTICNNCGRETSRSEQSLVPQKAECNMINGTAVFTFTSSKTESDREITHIYHVILPLSWAKGLAGKITEAINLQEEDKD